MMNRGRKIFGIVCSAALIACVAAPAMAFTVEVMNDTVKSAQVVISVGQPVVVQGSNRMVCHGMGQSVPAQTSYTFNTSSDCLSTITVTVDGTRISKSADGSTPPAGQPCVPINCQDSLWKVSGTDSYKLQRMR